MGIASPHPQYDYRSLQICVIIILCSHCSAALLFFELISDVLPIVHPRTQAFLDHWRAIPRREGVIAPHTDDFLDQAPARFMASVFIQEVVDDSLLVRFMGTDLVERWRRDDTGKEFGGRLPPEAKARVVNAASRVALHPCGILQHGVLGTSAGREASFEGVLLPLAVDAGAPPRIVVFSVVLDSLEREEHGNQFASAGERWWIDVGAGVPSEPPPSR